MLVFRGVMDSFCSDSDSPPPKKNSQNKVTPRHTPVYRAACRLYTAYFPNLSSLIIHTDTYDIGLETYWKMIPPQPKNLHKISSHQSTPPTSHWPQRNDCEAQYIRIATISNPAPIGQYCPKLRGPDPVVRWIYGLPIGGTLGGCWDVDFLGCFWKWKHQKMFVDICFVC